MRSITMGNYAKLVYRPQEEKDFNDWFTWLYYDLEYNKEESINIALEFSKYKKEKYNK